MGGLSRQEDLTFDLADLANLPGAGAGASQ